MCKYIYLIFKRNLVSIKTFFHANNKGLVLNILSISIVCSYLILPMICQLYILYIPNMIKYLVQNLYHSLRILIDSKSLNFHSWNISIYRAICSISDVGSIMLHVVLFVIVLIYVYVKQTKTMKLFVWIVILQNELISGLLIV